MTQFSDNFFLGDAPTPLTDANQSSGARGVGPMGRMWFLEITPTALSTTNIAGTQAITTSMTLAGPTLSNGTAILDVERTVRITNAGTVDISGTNVTVNGFDRYGQFLSNTIAGPAGTSTVETLKPYKAVTSITWPGTNASIVSAGTGDSFGFPWRVPNAAYVQSARIVTGGTGTNVFAVDTGTIRPADTTATATATTGPVRGTYKPATASDGTRVLVVGVYASDVQAGPAGSATQIGAIGVTQA